MRANLVGFELHVGKTVSLEEFFDHLSAQQDRTIRFGPNDRLIYVAEQDGYYRGLFITVKDQKKFCELREESGGFKITVRALGEGTSVVDFNFFVVNKTTARGLYLRYHNSCSINQFGLFCRRQYDDLRLAKKKADLDALGPAPDKKAEKAIADRYKKVFLSLVVMVRREKLADLLEELDQVNMFEFDMETLDAIEPTFTPVKPFVKRETHKVRFEKAPSHGIVRNWIAQMVILKNITKGRVQGTDEDGATRAFRLLDNPDSFGSYDYNEVADETILTLQNFQDSPFFDEMLRTVRAHRHLFEVEVGP